MALLPATAVSNPYANLTDGRAIAVKVLESFPSRPIPEIARLGRTLNGWKDQFLAYVTTARADNGGAEAVNGIIVLDRRIARGFRNPTIYRIRMILAAGGPTHRTSDEHHTEACTAADLAESHRSSPQLP